MFPLVMAFLLGKSYSSLIAEIFSIATVLVLNIEPEKQASAISNVLFEEIPLKYSCTCPLDTHVLRLFLSLSERNQ